MSSPSVADSTTAVPTSRNEFHVASPTMSDTGRSVRNDVPQSPCAKSPSQSTYCSGTGLVEVVLVLEVADRLLRDRRLVPEVAQRVTTRGDEQEHHERRQ